MVLGGSFLSEGGSCLVALNETRKKAKERGMGYIEYSTFSYDSFTFTETDPGTESDSDSKPDGYIVLCRTC